MRIENGEIKAGEVTRLRAELERVERLIGEARAADDARLLKWIDHLEGRRDVLRWEMDKHGRAGDH